MSCVIFPGSAHLGGQGMLFVPVTPLGARLMYFSCHRPFGWPGCKFFCPCWQSARPTWGCDCLHGLPCPPWQSARPTWGCDCQDGLLCPNPAFPTWGTLGADFPHFVVFMILMPFWGLVFIICDFLLCSRNLSISRLVIKERGCPPFSPPNLPRFIAYLVT